MADLSRLVKSTGAYKIVKGDKQAGKLSHAYLIVCSDGVNLSEYLKVFAKLMTCREDDPCGVCRSCALIDKGEYSDVISFPKNGENIVVDDVSLLIEESYLKPIEADRKLFVINHGETMSAVVQNKLLKTLEEPPANVHILIGTTSEYPLLQTVKSRVKKLEINGFSDEALREALKYDCPDQEKLGNAIACGDGSVGRALMLYGDDKLESMTELVIDTIVNMKSSRDVLRFSTKITSAKVDVGEFISVTESVLRDMLSGASGREDLIKNRSVYQRTRMAKGFNTGAIIYALDRIGEAYKRKKFNAGGSMLLEWLLFQILEGKFKWQKS